MRTLIIVLGTIAGFVAALPLPWLLRVWMARAMHHTVRWCLRRWPQIYGFVTKENVRHGMGKQQAGEMESIMGLELVLQEVEKRKITPLQLKEVFNESKAKGIKPVDLPRFLGERLLGAEDTDRLLTNIVAL